MDTNKKVCRNCLLKGFIIDDAISTFSWRKAVEAFKDGKEVTMTVHAKGYGCWKTSPIVNIVNKGGIRIVETGGHFYDIIGKEPSKWIKEAKFINPDGRRVLTTKRREDLLKIKNLIVQGNKIRAEVTFRNGGMNYTSEIKEFIPSRRKMVTVSQSVYRW